MFFLLFVFTIVALYGLTFSMAKEKVPAGQKVFIDKKCGSCHSVESLDLTSKKKDAVDLSATGDKLNADVIKTYVTKKEKLNDQLHKIAFKGTDEELAELAAWLETLKKDDK